MALLRRTIYCNNCILIKKQMLHKRTLTVFLVVIACFFMGASKVDSNRQQSMLNMYMEQNKLKLETIATEQGLSNPSVYGILQDKQGFMWFATKDGLNRYDGYEFKVYRNEIGNENSLSNNYITAIAEDKQGILWIGTRGGGLNRIEPESGKVVRYMSNSKDENWITSNNIWCIYPDIDQKNIWIGTDEGLFKLEKANSRFTSFKDNKKMNEGSIGNNAILSIIADSNGNLLVGTDVGLDVMTLKTGRVKHYYNEKLDKTSILPGSVWSIYEDHNKDIWVGTDGGLNKFNKAKTGFTHYTNTSDKYSISNGSVVSILEGKNGILWIGTSGGGLNKFNPTTGEFVKYRSNNVDKNGLANNNVWSLCKDDNGAIWVGTSNGVNKFNTSRFLNYTTIEGNDNSLINNNVLSMEKDTLGNLWVGTYDGLCEYDMKNQKVNKYRHDAKDKNSISDNIINCIAKAKSGDLWIGTTLGGLNRYVKSENKFYAYLHKDHENQTISSNNVYSILNIDENSVWVGTSEGLDCFDKKSGKFVSYINNSDLENYKLNNTIKHIMKGTGDFLLLGTENGLKGFDIKTKKIIEYNNLDKNAAKLTRMSIKHIYRDKSGMVWCATNFGIIKIYESAHNYEYVVATNEKLNPSIKSILDVEEVENGGSENKREGQVQGQIEKENVNLSESESGNENDSDNVLWLSTNNGITRYNKKDGNIKNFPLNEVNQNVEFNPGACLRDENGELLFGSINGIYSFFPKDLDSEEKLPKIEITGLKKFDVSVDFNDLMSSDGRLELSYKDNFFGFNFSILDYVNSSKNQYAYMLEGFDKDWINCGNRNYATYTNLNGGTYVFKVKGANSYGVWNVAGKAIKIHIKPPIWKTWWAYAFYGLVLSAFVFGYVKVKTKNQKKELENQKLVLNSVLEADKVKAEFLQGLQKIINSSAEIFELQGSKDFTGEVLKQLDNIFYFNKDKTEKPEESFIFIAEKIENKFEIIASNRTPDSILTTRMNASRFDTEAISEAAITVTDQVVAEDILESISSDIEEAYRTKRNLYYNNRFILHLKNVSGHDRIIYMGNIDMQNEWNKDLIEIFSKNIEIAFDNVYLNHEIESTQKEIIFTLGEVVEVRSQETGNHVKRVAEYSRILALKYGIPCEEAETLWVASPMHDIGKVGIPDSILNKPGKLTSEEFEIIKTHTTIGYEMLKNSSREILKTAAIIAFEHQEKYDGTGYPRKLAGDEIHIFGRITAIADVFDALGSERVYKKAWELQQILDYLKQEKGKHFDPELIDIFFDNLEEILAIRDVLVD